MALLFCCPMLNRWPEYRGVMELVVSGVLAIVVGLLLCFAGFRLAKIALAIWGAFIGFAVGFTLTSAGAGAGGWAAAFPGWVAGLILAVLFGWLAYAFYAAAVIVLTGSLGWLLGAGIALLFSMVPMAWLFGLVGAIALIVLGFALNLPRMLMILATAIMGAVVSGDGLRTLLGVHPLLDPTNWVVAGSNDGMISVGVVVLAILGVVAQLRQSGKASLREAYASK